MTPELWEKPGLWERLKPLFDAAMDKPEVDRARFIEEACGSDRQLRSALERLVKASGDSTAPADRRLFDLHQLIPEHRSAFATGELVKGRFRIERQIGSGGMGEVYEAFDLELERRIALKTIRADVASNPRMLAHFTNEVKLAQKISGTHVCRIHELYPQEISPSGRSPAFLTMEYLDGVTLTDRIREQGPMPWKQVKAIALEICEGLRAMHEVGIIHRDLKSRNVMLANRNGTVAAVIMDFGLAHEVRTATSETATDVSEEHGVAGTVEYMAPEQFEGHRLTPAADIFALGVVMYEMATGKHPFPSHTILQAAVQRGRKPAAPSSIQKKLPHRCDEIVCRCLEFDPRKRYGEADQVAKQLRAGPANISSLRLDHPWAFRVACGLLIGAIGWGAFRLFQLWQYDSPSSEGHKWYDAGVAALREGSYVKATRLLSAAIGSDSHFAMAHARLAEAWSNLDFDGKSTQELLIALGGQHHLRPLDSLYLDAIHATLTLDYAAAVLLYRKILDHLPDDSAQRAAGYVDLGMAYERAGDPTHARESFLKSESLDGDNPAAYMQEAILDTRLHKVDEANRAFSKAEMIFAREMNQEGQAELAYERGYEANQEGNSDQANGFLNLSLSEATQIQDVQLEIRDLTQLSSVAGASGHPPEAVEFAQRSIRLARENQLDAWAAMGLARLAVAEYIQGPQHFRVSEDAIHEALSLVKNSRQSRAEALANVTLAGLRDQQHRWEEIIAPATVALKYYDQNGYFEPAANATLLILRANERQGNFHDTLRAANDFRSLAMKSGSRDLLMQAEAELGTTLRAAEQYPDALPHFQRALALADDETNRAYLTVSQAENLVKLGRFVDADALLRPITKVESVSGDVGGVRLDGLLYQEKYGQALNLANVLISSHPEMVTELREEIEYERSISEAHLQRKSDALRSLDGAAPLENETDPAERWTLALQAADVKVLCGRTVEGRDDATAAEAYFASKNELDSELHAALLAATAYKSLHDDQNSARYLAKAIDILSSLEHNWGPREYHSYISRPDILALMRILPPGDPSKR